SRLHEGRERQTESRTIEPAREADAHAALGDGQALSAGAATQPGGEAPDGQRQRVRPRAPRHPDRFHAVLDSQRKDGAADEGPELQVLMRVDVPDRMSNAANALELCPQLTLDVVGVDPTE